MANKFYGESIVAPLFPLTRIVTGEDFTYPSIQTLKVVINRGEAW
jgi:hypothetical protein